MFIAEAGAITFTTHSGRAVGDRAAAFATHDVFVDLCADLVGPDVNMYWDQAVYKKPEKPRRFPWHQDNGYTFVEPQQYLTCWVALTDATEANGCPWVAPGVHQAGTLAHHYVEPLGFECFDDPPDKIAAPVRAGGAVVFSSLTPHLTGPNLTDEVRKAYILQYAHARSEVLQGDPTRARRRTRAVQRSAASVPGAPKPDAQRPRLGGIAGAETRLSEKSSSGAPRRVLRIAAQTVEGALPAEPGSEPSEGIVPSGRGLGGLEAGQLHRGPP